MDLASPSSSASGVPLSPATVRFRMLVSHFMSPAEEAKLLGYKDGEVQLHLAPANKAPTFIVLIDGAREEERSLRLRLGRFATEKVDNQHVVVVGNHGWMQEAMRKLGEEFAPRLSLYLLNSEGELELKAKKPLPTLMSALKAQRKRQLPVAGVPVFTDGMNDSGLASETESDFATRCSRAEETKERLREEYADLLKQRLPAVTIAIVFLQVVLLALVRVLQKGSDNTTVLVQLGAAVPPFIKNGDWWRLLASAEIHASLVSGLLGILVLLSIGTLLEKLLGSARFMTLHVFGALGGALVSLLWPRGALVISVGASGAACALLGAAAVMALDPGGLPPAEVQRLRKIAVSGLVLTVVLTFLPGVDKPTNLGGIAVGAVLMASGLLRPPTLGRDGKPSENIIMFWLHNGLAIVTGLLLVASLALTMLKGQPWQPDPSWKKRLSTLQRGGSDPGTTTTGTPSGDKPAGGPATNSDEELVRRELGDSGASIELPKGLGELSAKGEPGRTPNYEVGDLGENQQLLSVLVQRHPKTFKGKLLAQAFDQAVVQLKADRLRDDRVTVLTPPQKSTVDGFSTMEFHVRTQENVQARGLVQTRPSQTILFWYIFTDLLPEPAQLDLKRVLRSLKFAAAEAPTEKVEKKSKKKKR